MINYIEGNKITLNSNCEFTDTHVYHLTVAWNYTEISITYEITHNFNQFKK